MLSNPTETSDRDRATLIGYIADKLQPLDRTRPLRQDMTAWLGKLSTAQLIACLNQDPAATADALASRLVGDVPDGIDAVTDQLLQLAEVEFPRTAHRDRLRLATLAATMRRLAIDGDGTAKIGELYAEGFKAGELHELRPLARRLLALLGGTAQRGRLPNDETTPTARLAMLGARAAAQSASL